MDKRSTFAKHFNEQWRTFARSAKLPDAVLAIAVYEIFDRPDYSALYTSVCSIDENWDLEFFRLHSVVEHFEMFEGFVDWYLRTRENGSVHFENVAQFVLDTQKHMWKGLLVESADTAVAPSVWKEA